MSCTTSFKTNCLFLRCLDNDVDENTLNMAAAADSNNLDRETGSAGILASAMSNIDVTDDKRFVSFIFVLYLSCVIE